MRQARWRHSGWDYPPDRGRPAPSTRRPGRCAVALSPGGQPGWAHTGWTGPPARAGGRPLMELSSFPH
jgi:hypothetical protein